MDRPFMEHPSGRFETAVDAIADAIKRLRGLPEWNRWITFTAQGMGGRVDSYHLAAIRMRQDDIRLGRVDIQASQQSRPASWTKPRKLRAVFS